LTDPDPTAVAAALDVHFVGAPVAFEAFLDPGLAAPFRVRDQSAIGGSSHNRLEARAGYHHVGVGRKELAIMAVVNDEPVFRLVQREPFGYGLDRIGESAACFAGLLEVCFPHLDRPCAGYA